MRAWEIRDASLALCEVVSPAVSEGHVRVRVVYAGICGSDVPKLLQPDRFCLPEPWRPGHEVVGVDDLGRLVAVDPLVPCERCQRCAAGATHLCCDLQRIGWDLPGGLAEEVLVPASNIHQLPDGLDPLHAVLADPAAVAIHGLHDCFVADSGRCAVVGAGVVGLLSGLVAHRMGASVTVFHRETRPQRRTVAKSLPFSFRPSSMANEHGTFDLVIDAASGGDSTPIELAIRLVRDGGVIRVLNAYHPAVVLSTPLRDIFRRSIRLEGSFSYCRREQSDFSSALTLLKDHAVQIGLLVDLAGGLMDLPMALQAGSGTGRRVLAVG
ncbi:MAG: alcohol dehydrogenase catalytic domain-containing protein [Micromonosporaceae bacterium]|nr:alcohol dehydrogenase catalytic domain-containing protein [Micromonosporaceae bacterium]